MQTNKLVQYIVYIIISGCLTSCMNYYKISNSRLNNSTPETVVQNNTQRYFILRNGAGAYHMSNIIVSDDKKSLTCILDTLPSQHKVHLSKGSDGNMRYRKTEGQQVVLNEIHLYVAYDSAAKPGNNYSLQFDKIIRIEVLEKDNYRTSNSHNWGWIGLTVGVIGTFLIVAAIATANMF